MSLTPNDDFRLRPAADLPELLTTSEAAAWLKITPNTLHKWCSQKKIAKTRVAGSRTMFRRSEVLRVAGIEVEPLASVRSGRVA